MKKTMKLLALCLALVLPLLTACGNDNDPSVSGAKESGGNGAEETTEPNGSDENAENELMPKNPLPATVSTAFTGRDLSVDREYKWEANKVTYLNGTEVLTEWEFDDNGNMTKYFNYMRSNEAYYTYEYDADGNRTVVEEYDSDGKLTYRREYEYDGNHNVTRSTVYYHGVITDCTVSTYDSSDRLIAQSVYYQTKSGVTSFGTLNHYLYEYDGSGNLVQVKSTFNDQKLLEYFDLGDDGNVIIKGNPENETYSLSESNEYDANGNLINQMKYKKGKQEPYYTAVYKYNEDGNEVSLSTVESSGVAVNRSYTDWEYDDHGNLTKVTTESQNGTFTSSYSYEYDDAGNITKKRANRNYEFDYCYTYEYDENNNVIAMEELDDKGMVQRKYVYDSDGVLVTLYKYRSKYDRDAPGTLQNREDYINGNIVKNTEFDKNGAESYVAIYQWISGSEAQYKFLQNEENMPPAF